MCDEYLLDHFPVCADLLEGIFCVWAVSCESERVVWDEYLVLPVDRHEHAVPASLELELAVEVPIDIIR